MWKCWLKSGRYKESSFGGGIYFFKMVLPVLLDGFSSSKSMMTCFKSRVHFPHIWIVKQKLLKSVWNLDLFLNSSHFFTVNWCVIRVLRFLLNLIEWDAFFFFSFRQTALILQSQLKQFLLRKWRSCRLTNSSHQSRSLLSHLSVIMLVLSAGTGCQRSRKFQPPNSAL